jgi:hypothetical protein
MSPLPQTGIAISSRVDDIGEELMYCVYLESGHLLDINMGFLEVILPGREGCEEQREPTRGQVHSQELQTHGCYSSCEEDTDQEDDGNHWPTEMLHNPNLYNFPWPLDATAGSVEEAQSDSEIERAAESLQGEWMHCGQDVAQRGRGCAAVSTRRRGKARGSTGRQGQGRSAGLSTTVHGDAIAHAQPGGGAIAAPPVPGQPGGMSCGTPDPALADKVRPGAGS